LRGENSGGNLVAKHREKQGDEGIPATVAESLNAAKRAS
jgi:hypothetical protein